ncbi:MAG: DMT family transporter [Rhizobiales bacterium]|nr:DMT family transporter [Hyphomicrobiales bacterium]
MQSHSRRETLKGILLLVASVSLFGVVDGLSKVLVETQSFGQIMLARYGLALPLFYVVSGFPKPAALFRSARPGTQILRAIAPLIIGGAMVFAVRYLPLAEATVILFAGPFLVVALSGPLLGERVGMASWIGVVLGFIAVFMVARPGFSDVSVYAVFPLVAALFYAVFQMLTRHLSAAAEKTETTLAWTLAIGLAVSVPLAAAEWVPVSATAWLLAIVLSIVFAAGQLLLVRAYDHAAANILAPFSYVQIIAATVFGLLAFGDMPDLWTLLGIALIIIAGVYVMRGNSGS